MIPLFLLLVTSAVCTTASPDCSERVSAGPDGKWTLLYRSHALTKPNPAIRRAAIMVHGQGRNADDYFRTMMAAGFLAGALEDTIIISPRFSSNNADGCKDHLSEGELNQPCRGKSWRGGGEAENAPHGTSFHVMDEVLRRLADKKKFPNLQFITLAGHSAGGQFVHRYAAATKAVDGLGVPVKFVVSNPSSYLYLDARRYAAEGKLGEFAGAAKCQGFNSYLYGLEQRYGYAADLSDEQLKSNLARRDVVYLLGELDTEPLAGFDSSCSAMAQGKSRLQRGQQYWQYIRSEYKAGHELVKVPLCGHNARCVFTSDPAQKVVFGK